MRQSIFSSGWRNLSLFVLSMAVVSCGSGEASPSGRGGPPQKNRPVTVRVEPVKTGPIRVQLEFVGEVHARQAVDIAAPAAGKVRAVLVDMGQRVEAGELLAQLDSASVQAKLAETRASHTVSRAAIHRAEAEFRSVESELSRKAPLADDNLITPQEMDQLRSRHDAAKANLDVSRAQVVQAAAAVKVLSQQLVDTRLIAPFAGRIEARHLDPGAVVNAGTPVLRLVHTDPAVVRFQVSEAQVGRLRGRFLEAGEGGEGGERGEGGEGDTEGVIVSLSLSAYPEKRWTGRLVRISPALDPQTRAAAAEAEFENENNELMPGMYCRLSINLGGRDKALLVPLRAVVKRQGTDRSNDDRQGNDGAEESPTGRSVFVVRDGAAKAIPITLGVEQGRYGEVLEGLADGDDVVVEGQSSLRDGKAVKVVSNQNRSKAR